MVKIEENLLTNKAIYLNLTLQERATGLDDIVGDLSFYFNLPVFFWNLSKSNASRVVLREQIAANVQNLQATPETIEILNSDWDTVVVHKKYASMLTQRLQDKQLEGLHTQATQSFEGIISALAEIYRSEESGIFMVENIDQLLTSKTISIFEYEQLKTWMLKLAQKARKTKDFYLVILGSSPEKWHFEELAPLITLPYLNHREIAEVLKNKFAKLELKDSDKHELIEKAGHILTGMSKPELHWGIDNITNSLKQDNSVSTYIDGLLKFKQEKLSQMGLSFLPPPEINSVGGMDILKENIDNLKILFSCDRQKYNIPQEQGWALVGVPGAGKSLVAKVMQFELALPMIHIPIDQVKDRGPSYLAHVFSLCEAYAPNIVYIDELDKMFNTGDLQGDAATTLAVFLTWLQEKQAPCFILATLNRLDTLPPELLRSGRFSEVFYVGFPQPKERREIFQLYLEKYDSRYQEDIISIEQWRELIDESIKFTGAEIAAVVKKAYLAKFYERRKTCIKLENKKFELIDKLKSAIMIGYQILLKNRSPYQIDLNHLNREINKLLFELPEHAEQIDKFYARLSDLASLDTRKTEVDRLNQLIDRGYREIIENMARNTVGIDEVNAMISKAMVDLAGQKQVIEALKTVYGCLVEVKKILERLDTQPLKIDFESVLELTIAEIPLFERSVEKVMMIENRARKMCKPVSSPDTSALIDKEPSFWQNMKPAEAVEVINEVREAQTSAEGEDYEPINDLDEAIDESELENYWAF